MNVETQLMALARGTSYDSEAEREEIAGLLIEHGAKVNFINRICQTAYSLATEWGQDKMEQLLLDAGADTQLHPACIASLKAARSNQAAPDATSCR